jgi:hypothetical protein
VSIGVRDRRGALIELTDERWAHICQAHPELTDHQEQILDTVRWGSRNQDPLDPSLWKYSRPWPDLPEDFTHLIVVVRQRKTRFIVTAYGVEQ